MSHMVVLFLVFLGNSHSVFHSGYTNLHSQQQCIRVHLYRHTHQDLLFPTFLMITMLMGVTWYLIVVLNFPDDKWYWASFPVLVGHLYVFFIKCLFTSGLPPIFKLGCLIFSLSCMSCLYILKFDPLSVISLANIFSHLVRCLFCHWFPSGSAKTFKSD